MKTFINITLLLFLVSQNLLAQYNISPDAPKNPLPFYYHKEHFKLKGDIKAKRHRYDDGDLEDYIFNKQGYLIQYKFKAKRKDIYYYDSKNRLISIVTQSAYPSKTEFVLDEKNRIIEKQKSTGRTEKYEYDAKGNLIKIFSDVLSDRLYLDTKYTYDNQNRLIKKQEFKPDGSIRMTTTYAYQREGKYLKISIDSGGYTFVEYYDKNGHHCGDKPAEIKTDEKGNPLTDPRITYIYFSDPGNALNCISGDCQNGWGTYQYEDGAYTGFFNNGLRDGYGKFVWNSGQAYEGQWTQDKITGYGILQISTTAVKQGEFVDGKLNGLGIVQTQNKYQPGIYKNGELVTAYIFTLNGKQTGCVGGDCSNGFGQYHWESGSKFLGFFKDGKAYLGTYSFSNGNMYIGYFNQRIETDRFGFYIHKTGDVYYGEWKNGKYHGKGYYKYLNGTEYSGTWENGKFIKSLK